MNVFLMDKAFYYYKATNILRLDPVETKLLKQKITDDTVYRKNSPLIILFGDSRIANWRPLIDLPDCTVMNMGIRGQTTSQLRLRLVKDVLSYSPDIVVLQAGINDLKNIGIFPERKANIIKHCKENILYIIDRISDEGIPVVVLTIFPTGRPGLIRSWFWPEETDTAVRSMNAFLIQTQDEKIHIIEVDRILGKDRHVHPEFKKDMLHINHRGYEQLNAFVQPLLMKLKPNSIK